MTTMRLDLAYNGARFAGWAAQPGLRTVQSELEGALEQVLGARTSLTVAGRTDAGVHAWGQVASFEVAREPPPALRTALHSITGDDLAVRGLREAPDGFDARRDARSRTYCYRVHLTRTHDPFERGLSLFWPHRMETEGLEACARALLGSHDFTAFTPTQTEHVHFEREVIRAGWDREPERPGREGEVIRFWIEADAFMRNMVRVLVGTMLEVGSARRTLEDFERLLDGAPREAAADTARPHGLYLSSVSYPDGSD